MKNDIKPLMASGGEALLAASDEVNAMLEALQKNTSNMAEMVTAVTMLSAALALSITPIEMTNDAVSYQHKVLLSMAAVASGGNNGLQDLFSPAMAEEVGTVH